MSERPDAASAEPPYVILGCGYTGARLTQALRAEGVAVRACARRLSALEPLRELGATLHYLDGSKPRQFLSALHGLRNPVVVYSIPGVMDLPAGEAVRRATEAARQVNASAFIYLGTSGVYGRNELPNNDEWVDEDTVVAISDVDMKSRVADEASVSLAAQGGLRAVVLRLAAIYGPALSAHQPARGVRQRLRRGEYRLVNGGRGYMSRIHVDDLVTVIRAAALRAPPGAVYVVGDDHPCPAGEYGRWLAAHLGLPEPPPAETTGVPRSMQRGRRLRNQRLHRELGVVLRYPSYREGEAQIDATEAGADPGPTPLRAVLGDESCAPQAAVAPTAPLAPPPPPAVLAPGEDLGARLFGGRAPAGIRLLQLQPGDHAPRGVAYLVLSGAPALADTTDPLPALAMVTPTQALHLPREARGPALLLALSPPPP